MRVTIFIADIRKAGGTERATVNLANLLSSQHEITIVSLSKRGDMFFEVRENVTITFLNLPPMPKKLTSKPNWYVCFYKTVKKHLKEQKPDMAFGTGHNISIVLSLLKKKDRKMIALEHIDFTSIPTISRVCIKWAYKRLNAVVVLSTDAFEKIRSFNSNIEIIPNVLPFSTDVVSNLQRQKLIMVGRISQEKGYERIIPIAKRLATYNPDWEICIFGEGDKKVWLQQKLDNNAIKNVSILPPVKNIKSEYLTSSVLLMTSYYEAMPMVILEAHHCGLPVVGYDCQGVNLLIKNGENGFIVKDDNEFYTKLNLLIENLELRQDMGKKARLTSLYYNTENIKTKWNEFIKGL